MTLACVTRRHTLAQARARARPSLPPPPPLSSIAGIGAAPWGVRYLWNGEAPRVKDDFERYTLARDYWERGNEWCQTRFMKDAAARPALDAAWRDAHAEVAKKGRA